jgi:hypothetical protein
MFNAAPDEPDSGAIADRCREANRPAGRATTAQTRQIATTCNNAARDSMAAWREPARRYFRGAAGAFEMGLVRNPGNRDALFNVVNTYYRLQDTVMMLGAAQQLHATDPMNRNTLRLVAAAWHLRGQPDSTLYYLQVADSVLPVEVTVTSFVVGDTRATLTGLVTSLREQRTAPVTLAFEFTDNKGAVVASASTALPALEPGSSHQLEVRVEGTGIAAWRYRRE